MRRAWATFCGVIAFALAIFATPGVAARPPKNPDPDETRAILAELQAKDQRLQDIGWRLVRGNADFCDGVIPAVGLTLQDTAAFGNPHKVRSALDLSGAFAVQTSAKGSPAGLSGDFSPNREIRTIAEANPNFWEAEDRLYWQRLTRVHDWIDHKLAEQGEVTFRFADRSTSTLEPLAVCATRFELLGDSKTAMAEGSRVIIGQRFPGFDWEEDDEFAGVVAHELAHNLLRHRVWLDRHGGEKRRKRMDVRLTEREADRLMPWLLANAGYDPQAAYRFMVRWGKKHDGGLFRARTHDGWDERAEFIAAELPRIEELMAREGKADWSIHFRREIDPEEGLPPRDGVAQRE